MEDVVCGFFDGCVEFVGKGFDSVLCCVNVEVYFVVEEVVGIEVIG